MTFSMPCIIFQKSLISSVNILPSWSFFLDLEKHFFALFLRTVLMFDEFLHISDKVFYYFHLPPFSCTFIPQNLENKRPHINTSSYFLWNVRKLTELLIFSTDVNVSRLFNVSRKNISFQSSRMMTISEEYTVTARLKT